jgi:hypothetical protein
MAGAKAIALQSLCITALRLDKPLSLCLKPHGAMRRNEAVHNYDAERGILPLPDGSGFAGLAVAFSF